MHRHEKALFTHTELKKKHTQKKFYIIKTDNYIYTTRPYKEEFHKGKYRNSVLTGTLNLLNFYISSELRKIESKNR